MKWYERQKQLYAQKNQPEETVAPQEDMFASTSTYEEPIASEEPVFEEEPNTQQYYEEVVDENEYEEDFSDQQLDEMMDETSQFQNQATYEQETYASVNIPEMDEDVTTISKGTQLIGNIESDGDLIIRGHIKGDVLCNANLSVYGVIEGTVTCANAFFDEAIIVGDIGCNGNLELTATCTIDGNVEAYEIMNGGRIKGNATVEQSIHFLSTSAIIGDINANDIDIERGAVIQGNVNIRQEVYFEN